MKIKILFLCFSIAVIPFLDGCKKYKDAPSNISLRSKKGRLTNEWKLTTYYYNDSIYTGTLPVHTLDIKVNGTYTESDASSSYSGIWDLSSNHKEVVLTENGTSNVEKYTIKCLESKTLWLKQVDGKDNYEWHYEKNNFLK